MVVISYGALRAFFEKYPDSKDALNNWYRLAVQADWDSFHEIKELFGSVYALRNDRYVFNIRGDHYPLVTMIFFDVRTIYIRFIGHHKDYDKIDCSTI